MPKHHIAHEELLERFIYDPDTGIFSRRTAFVGGKGIGKGSPAGFAFKTKNGNGYTRFAIDGVKYYAHRLAWFYVYGKIPTHQIDHMNGDRSDNRLCNLREATNAQNSQNTRLPRKSGSTGLLGVTPSKSKNTYIAQIVADGKHIHVGTYATPEEAHVAYLNKKEELHKFYIAKTQKVAPK